MRPTFAEIDLHALNSNLRQIRKKVGPHPLIMAVVKANAYGHGVLPVVRSIRKQRTAQYFGVALVEEGMEIRNAGVRDPVHVFTAPMRDQLDLFVRHSLEPTLCDLSIAKALNAIARRRKTVAAVHVKVDTGMGRIGVAARDAVEFVKRIDASFPNLFIKGIWTHFATSDERDLSYARKQLSAFRSIVTELELNGIHIPLVHCANSGAILQLPESYFDMVRPGIMMYGYTPSLETRKTVPLIPALSLRARIGFVKTVEKGMSISYGRRFVAKRRTTIASISVGYADGYFRSLTNKSAVLIRGKRYPVAGTVCMDQIMIDAGSDRIAVGDEVVLIGNSKGATVTGWDIARAAGTIPYEVTCAISQRVPRRYING